MMSNDIRLSTREIAVANALLGHWESNQQLGFVARVVSQVSISLQAKLKVADIKQAIYKAKVLGLLEH